MGIGNLNSAIYKRAYTSEAMEAIWNEAALVSAIFEVEATLARVQADMGMVPREAAEQIRIHATPSEGLLADIAEGRVGNPLVSVLDALRPRVPEEHRQWIHFGATTQDVLDTARALQVKRATALLLAQIAELGAVVADMTDQHAATLMVARTNGQHALPTTLGMRGARWLAELSRDRDRLTQMRSRTQLIQFSGAAGTYASWGPRGPELAERLAQSLGLVAEPIPWHAAADVMTELACAVAILAQTFAKMSDDLFAMQQTDIGEAREPMDAHSSGSSTMPQKLNPFTTMKVSVSARLVAGMAATLLTQPPASFERDHRQSEVQRDLIPQIFVATSGACARLEGLLARLRFDTDALRQNTASEGVLLVTEGIMMALAPFLGRDVAHDTLQDFAAQHRATGISLAEFVAQRPELQRRLEGFDLEAISSPESYTGASEEQARAAARRFHARTPTPDHTNAAPAAGRGHE